MVRPLNLDELLRSEEWLNEFCTYKQLRSIIHRMEHHKERPIKITLEEGDENQNFITIEYASGVKITF